MLGTQKNQRRRINFFGGYGDVTMLSAITNLEMKPISSLALFVLMAGLWEMGQGFQSGFSNAMFLV